MKNVVLSTIGLLAMTIVSGCGGKAPCDPSEPCGGAVVPPTATSVPPSPSPTRTVTSTSTATPTPTVRPTDVATASPTPTVTATSTARPTATETPEQTRTPTKTNTPAPVCTYLMPAGAPTTYTAQPGEGFFTVSTQAGCAWTAESGTSWVTVISPTGPATGTGQGRYSFSANSNVGGVRTGQLVVAGQYYVIHQNGR